MFVNETHASVRVDVALSQPVFANDTNVLLFGEGKT